MRWDRAVRADAPRIQALFDSDAETYALLEGAPPRPDEALHLFDDAPPGFALEHKHVFVVEDVAVIELLAGYPAAGTWYVGLIFIAAGARNRGLGTRLVGELCDLARQASAGALRLAVVVENVRARRFYDRLGFAHVARRPRVAWTGATQECDVLELAL